MKATTRYAIVGGVCLALSVSGAVRWRAALPSIVGVPATVGSVRGAAAPPPDSLLGSAEELIVSNDPFRLSNTPPTVRFNPASDAAIGVGVSLPVVRPTLSLKAIVGGPPWQAIVDGLPGVSPGTMIQPGAVFDKLAVRAVTRDSVIIQGPDTAWVLSFRKVP